MSTQLLPIWHINCKYKCFIKSSYVFLITQLPSHRAHFAKTSLKFTKNLTLCLHLWYLCHHCCLCVQVTLCVLVVEWSKHCKKIQPTNELSVTKVLDWFTQFAKNQSIVSKKLLGAEKNYIICARSLLLSPQFHWRRALKFNKWTQNVHHSTHNFNTQSLKICFLQHIMAG